MDLDRIARGCMTATIMTKRTMCEEGPTDLRPLVEVVGVDGGHRIAIVPDRDFIPVAVEALAGDDDDIAYVAFCGDAWHREYPIETDPESVRRGDMERAFKSGDMKVREQLIVTVIEAKTGALACLVTPYSIRDDGKPRFEQTEALDADPDHSQVVDNLKEATARWRTTT